MTKDEAKAALSDLAERFTLSDSHGTERAIRDIAHATGAQWTYTLRFTRVGDTMVPTLLLALEWDDGERFEKALTPPH